MSEAYQTTQKNKEEGAVGTAESESQSKCKETRQRKKDWLTKLLLTSLVTPV